MGEKEKFGFSCGSFSVALAADSVIVPGSNGTLKRSLLPNVADMNDAAGIYTLRAMHGAEIVCHLTVHVIWVEHPKEREPFLAFKCDDTNNVVATFRQYEGKKISLSFEPST